ncbi:MAG: NUDIX hydrolase [Candidatus Woykebacteria bacterium]
MKIPKEAKRVFEGIIFDVYHWKQKMFDGSTTTFEALKRPDTIQIIPVFDGKILLSYEEQPNRPATYTFLGGRQEKDEDQLVTAKRELLEETGLESDDWELFKVYDVEAKIEWQIYLFIARNCKKTTEPSLDAGEKIEVKAVDFEEFLNLAAQETFWGTEIANDIFRMKENKAKLEEFSKKLLG